MKGIHDTDICVSFALDRSNNGIAVVNGPPDYKTVEGFTR